MTGDPYKLVTTMANNNAVYDIVVEDLFDGDDVSCELHMQYLFQNLKSLSPELVIRHVYGASSDYLIMLTHYKQELFGNNAIMIIKEKHLFIVARKSGIRCSQAIGLDSLRNIGVTCIDTT